MCTLNTTKISDLLKFWFSLSCEQTNETGYQLKSQFERKFGSEVKPQSYPISTLTYNNLTQSMNFRQFRSFNSKDLPLRHDTTFLCLKRVPLSTFSNMLAVKANSLTWYCVPLLLTTVLGWGMFLLANDTFGILSTHPSMITISFPSRTAIPQFKMPFTRACTWYQNMNK